MSALERHLGALILSLVMLMAGGVTLLDPDEMHRVTPNDLFQCFYPKSELMRA